MATPRKVLLLILYRVCLTSDAPRIICLVTEVVSLGEDYPALVWRFTAGPPRYSVDLVKPDYTLKSTSPLDNFAKVPILGRITEGELASRNSIGELEEGGYNVVAVSRNLS